MHESTLRCGSCGHDHRVDAWRGLPRICTLSGVDVHRHVIAWPKDRVVEVRACQRCGESMARTATEVLR